MTIKSLWQDYLFLTNELEKFLMRKDFGMVNELLKQREKLQKTIDETPADSFFSTAEGHAMSDKIAAKNRGITQILHMLRNNTQKSHAVATAYDRLGKSNMGYRMDSRS